MIVKETDVDFIGSIPVHWEVVPVKYFSTFRMGQTILKEDLIENGKFPVYSATEKDHYFGSINNPQFILDEGDIVIPARGNSIGHIKLVHEKAVSTQTTIANFVDQDKVSSKFLFYFYKAFRENLFPYDNTAIPQITVEKIKDNKVALPPISEQTQIADFLDRKTAQIDNIIAKKEKMLTLLDEKKKAVINEAVTKGLNPNAKMKDSGIEWIGEIPENWEVKKLKYIIEVLTDFTANGSFGDLAKNVDYLDEGHSRLVRLTDLRVDFENTGIYVSEEAHKYLSKSELFGGELLLANVGAYAGLACLMPSIGIPATLGPNMFLIKFIEGINSKYVYYNFLSKYLHEQLLAKSISSAQPKLNKDDVRSCEILTCEINEQNEIIVFIDVQLQKIENIVQKISFQIEKLKEYRQSLISEVVTGKIDAKNYN